MTFLNTTLRGSVIFVIVSLVSYDLRGDAKELQFHASFLISSQSRFGESPPVETVRRTDADIQRPEGAYRVSRLRVANNDNIIQRPCI